MKWFLTAILRLISINHMNITSNQYNSHESIKIVYWFKLKLKSKSSVKIIFCCLHWDYVHSCILWKNNQISLYKKRGFQLRISSVNMTKSEETFTVEFLNGKFHFLCSVYYCILERYHLFGLISKVAVMKNVYLQE